MSTQHVVGRAGSTLLWLFQAVALQHQPFPQFPPQQSCAINQLTTQSYTESGDCKTHCLNREWAVTALWLSYAAVAVPARCHIIPDTVGSTTRHSGKHWA